MEKLTPFEPLWHQQFSNEKQAPDLETLLTFDTQCPKTPAVLNGLTAERHW